MSNDELHDKCTKEIARMVDLLNTKPLEIEYRGGGIPQPQTHQLDQALLVARYDLQEWKTLLTELRRKAQGF